MNNNFYKETEQEEKTYICGICDTLRDDIENFDKAIFDKSILNHICPDCQKK